jgi:hypothetical protein
MSATHGYPAAELNLGLRYLVFSIVYAPSHTHCQRSRQKGDGVARNIARGFLSIHRAADCGYAAALHNLGTLLQVQSTRGPAARCALEAQRLRRAGPA